MFGIFALDVKYFAQIPYSTEVLNIELVIEYLMNVSIMNRQFRNEML